MVHRLNKNKILTSIQVRLFKCQTVNKHNNSVMTITYVKLYKQYKFT